MAVWLVVPVALKRFLQEAQVMARTSHPNLVQVYDLEQIEGNREILVSKLKERYGVAHEEAHRQIDRWVDKLKF